MAPNQAPCRGSVATSKTEGKSLFSEEKTLVFASEWHFKPPGIKLVKERFEGELGRGQIAASHEYCKDQTFRVRCHEGDVNRVWKLFFDVIARIINDETDPSDDEDDNESWNGVYVEDQPMKSDLIESLEDYRKENGLAPVAEDPEQTENSTSITAIPDESFPEKVRYYKQKGIWPLPTDLQLDLVLPNKVLKELKDLTRCEFFKDQTEFKVYVGGHNEEDCLLAIQKLDALSRCPITLPSKVHLFYTEGEENFQIVFKPFTYIKEGYFKTTLLESMQQSQRSKFDHCTYKQLEAETTCTTRISHYNHQKFEYESSNKVKLTPAVKLEDIDRGLPEWVGFKYSGRGDPKKHQQQVLLPKPESVSMQNATAPLKSLLVSQFDAKENNKDAKIQLWVKDVPETPQSSALQDGNSGRGGLSSASAIKTEVAPSWDTYSSQHVPSQVSRPSVNLVSSGLTSRLANLRNRVPISRPEPPATLPAVVPHQVQNQKTCPQAKTQPTVTSQQPSHPLQSLARSTVPPPSAHASSKTSISQPHSQFGSSNVRSGSAIVTPAKNALEVLMDLYPPLQPTIITPAALEPTQFGQGTVSQSSSGSPPPERVQTSNEVASREFHQTMGQQAPKPKGKPKSDRLARNLPLPDPIKTTKIPTVVDPLPEFIGELRHSFAGEKGLISRAKFFRGQVQVQVEFGRIVLTHVHGKHVTKPRTGSTEKPTDRLHDANAVRRMLVNEPGPATSFTKALTTAAAEMPYILNLTDSSGEKIWVAKKPIWDVKYEFSFIDRHAAHGDGLFTVEIDAEKFTTQVKKSHQLGNIYIHGPGRHWDFRIAARGFETSRYLDEDYSPLASAIDSSLHVPSNSETPILFFDVAEWMKDRFDILGVQALRNCLYKSTDSKSMLKISENFLLDHQIVGRLQGKPWLRVKAVQGSLDQKPVDKLGHWFEVSISSVQLDEMLEENKKLHLGEGAQWTSDQVSESNFVESLYRPACEMLKKMDGVGQHNDNGFKRKPKEPQVTSTTSQVSEQPVAQW